MYDFSVNPKAKAAQKCGPTRFAIIQFYIPLFFTPQKMDLKAGTYSKRIAAVRIVL